MDSHSITFIAIIVVLLVVLACLNAAEVAFFSLSRTKIKNMAASDESSAQNVLKLFEDYERLQMTVIILNIIIKVTVASLATALFTSLLEGRGVAVAIVAIVLIFLLFTEIPPKTIAAEWAEKATIFFAPILNTFIILFKPLTWFTDLWEKLISRIFKLTDSGIEIEEELINIVEEAETEGSIGNEQSELIQNAIEFNELQASDVLTPRTDLVAIDRDTEEAELAELFRKTGFSRIPVYEDEIDNILGILSQKDFHNYIRGSGRPLSDFIKPVVFVAGSIKIAVLLKKMQSIKTHIAIVIDEYGGTEGIVTMEDIIEELVGEIFDEHDAVTSQDILKLRDDSYRILGSANLEKVLDFFDVEDEIDEIDVTTVNGWVVVELDRLPKPGDVFERVIGDKLFKVRVTMADERRAKEINLKVEKLHEEE
ncbi:MAG: hemolysin family protein [Eubacteriales bacterium]|nr:hemolysin family protein [Eubacteriales bacterium]MDD4390285.1 hemolysin family protein [Eubacteriales bacterium]